MQPNEFMGDKLKVINSKELVKFLLSKSFIVSRQKGSHIILHRENDRRTTVIPMHNKDYYEGF
ncbi:toxin HicA [candidate division WWE3 bacterium CG08_land_8_20_14_0_20_41_10]|uniref:Toxin HicA n=1 Tax=candidate division WWE3 bacterium CG08_land_8_20_14_0_20_41_10 TaxID=1975085 RepID=A0A2H0XBX4_UNCKA|nr:MAG: toxin HicA [candidate division WWE3 bacterium CG08_land_8_20_14_0_20_41_10]